MSKFTWSTGPVLPRVQQLQKDQGGCSSWLPLGLLLWRTLQSHPDSKYLKKKIQISTDYCAMTTVMQPHLSTAVLCHPFINHNLPKSCFSIANLSGKTAGTRRSLFLLALLSSLDHTPLGADTQLPQRPPGWWSDPSLWYHLQTGFWQQSWWKSNHPVCFLMKVCWSYL